MTTLRWVDAFTLNAPTLDRAHRRLFECLRDAIAALQDERRRDAARAVAALSDGSRRHFIEEEDLMRGTGYPGYYNHGEQHRRLLLGLERLQVAMAMRAPDTQASIRYLRRWFSMHLLRDDLALSIWLGHRRD